MNCPLGMVEDINHNTKMFTFKLPGASHMIVPTGHHIRIKGKDQEGSYIYVGKVTFPICIAVYIYIYI